MSAVTALPSCAPLRSRHVHNTKTTANFYILQRVFFSFIPLLNSYSLRPTSMPILFRNYACICNNNKIITSAAVVYVSCGRLRLANYTYNNKRWRRSYVFQVSRRHSQFLREKNIAIIIGCSVRMYMRAVGGCYVVSG